MQQIPTQAKGQAHSNILPVICIHIEVEICRPLFPEGKIFTYSNPDYLQQEETEFFIPLDAAEGDYTVTVRAYKNGQCLEAYPKAAVMELNGTVLDDFRRKILWN